MNRYSRYSATALAREIKSGGVSAREVVEAHIEDIEKVNPKLNAVVAERFKEARQEAEAADRLLKEKPPEDLPRFHGVPCTIKEAFALTGMPNASGVVKRKDIRATQDATAVSRLRRAGFIPLGVTNTSELCMWMESNNNLYGITNNPYNTERIVGGSSGGEGAIIAAGASPAGLGSDIGGSIRMPAFFNGIFGHKPSGGLVPGTGQYPVSKGKASRYLTTGPLCRSAEDLYPMLQIMAGPDGHDEGCEDIALLDPETVDISSLNVVSIESNNAIFVSEISADLQRAQRQAADQLQAGGCRVSTKELPLLRSSFDIWSSMLSEGNDETFAGLLGQGIKLNPFFETVKSVFRRSEHTFPAAMLALTEGVAAAAPGRAAHFIKKGYELQNDLNSLIGDGILLYPSYTRPAPKHHAPLATPFDWVYTAIFNVMQLPSTQIPLGLNSEGLPLGVQIVARHGNDHLTLAVAEYLSESIAHWVEPPAL